MIILHLHTGLNIACGISKTIYLIAKYSAGNNKHFVIALNGDAGKKFIDSGIRVLFLSYKRISVFKIRKTVKLIKKFVKENKIDIIHSHHRYFDFIAYILSFSTKIKRITSVQSIVYGKKAFSYKSPVLLAAGESVRQHMIEYFNIKENRIVVFNNFVDANEVPEKINIQSLKIGLNIPENSYLIGYTGRFSIKEKGIDILIEAFGLFNQKHTDSVLIMVGDGEDINKVTLPENVKIISPKENIFDYYGIFDCLVLPSRVDPFPLTALGAGMMKIPFIGAKVDGIKEIIENNSDGLLFEKGDVKSLLEKMELFFNEKEFAKKCADNLHKKVMEKYNVKDAIEKLNKIYEKL